jgi:hypothetical protein
MKRRRLLLCGGATIGGASILGTGAFTSVSAERTVSVAVAGDASAFLGLDATNAANGAYASEQGDDGELVLDFGDISEESRDGTVESGGSGVNQNAVTDFKDVFRVRNQGTQPIEVELKDENAGDVLHTNDPWDASRANTDADDVYVWYQYWQEGSGTTQAVTDREADTGQNGGINNYDKDNDKIGLKPGEQISVIIRVFADDDGSFDINENARIVIDANASDAERLQPS